MTKPPVWLHNRPPTYPTDRPTRKAIQTMVALERIERLDDWVEIDAEMMPLLYGWTTRHELLQGAISLWFWEKHQQNPTLLTHPDALKAKQTHPNLNYPPQTFKH